MSDDQIIQKLLELLESVIVDFEKLKLKPLADIYRAELEKLIHERLGNPRSLVDATIGALQQQVEDHKNACNGQIAELKAAKAKIDALAKEVRSRVKRRKEF